MHNFSEKIAISCESKIAISYWFPDEGDTEDDALTIYSVYKKDPEWVLDHIIAPDNPDHYWNIDHETTVMIKIGDEKAKKYIWRSEATIHHYLDEVEEDDEN